MDDVVARIKKTRIRLVAHDQIKILKQTKNESKAKFTRQNEHEFGTSRQQNCNVQRFAKELNFSQLHVLPASLPFLLLLSLPLCVLTVYSSCRCRCCLWCSKSSHAVLENVLRLSCKMRERVPESERESACVGARRAARRVRFAIMKSPKSSVNLFVPRCIR